MDGLYSAIAALALGSPFLAIVGIVAYYYLSRGPWRRNRRRSSTFSSSSGAMATVLLGLTLIYRPRLQYAVEAQQRQVEDADEDDDGAPETPTKHLLRQLRRIRRGEEVDRLMLRLE
jgi:hypothetical protein